MSQVMMTQCLPENYRSHLSKKKRLVIKLGSSILVDNENHLSASKIRTLAKSIANLWHQGIKVIMVSSGAIAAGLSYLGRSRLPHQIPVKQALAATGQTTLMNHYEKAFARHGIPVAQILLTMEDLSNRRRFLNSRHTLSELLKLKVLPIINENDTVAVHEIKVGDNDNLSALVTNVVEADLLINLSDVDGVFEKDPRIEPSAKRIKVIKRMDTWLRNQASDTLRVGSTGGMITKLQAAEKAQKFGVATVIANGKTRGILEKILRGDDVGTLILPKVGRDRLSGRKYWLAYGLKPQGQLMVDKGAYEAVMKQGKSLLPSGLRKVIGNFHQGDPVDLCLKDDKAFARGLTSYSAAELTQLVGVKSSEIKNILGYKYFDEVVHRSDLVLLKK